MKVKHIIRKMRASDTLKFNQITDLQLHNYGTSNCTVNGMKIPSGKSRNLLINVIADEFVIEVEFDSINQEDNMLELSYLIVKKQEITGTNCDPEIAS